MSREQIENRIRSLFFFLFGIIFAFLFILTSSYLNLTDEIVLRHKDQIKKVLVEGMIVREKQFFEEFMTKNFESINQRAAKYLDELGIRNHSVVIRDNSLCLFGSDKDCEVIGQLGSKLNLERASSFESLGKVYLHFPFNAWGSSVGSLSIIIPTNELVHERRFLDQLIYYVIPFLLLVLLTFIIYRFTEKNIIKPTINRIIETEKLELQRGLVRQFAHDIQSPIVALEAVLENSQDFPNDSKELVTTALDRITEISSDLLLRDRKLSKLSAKSISDVIDEVIKSKKLEHRDKSVLISKEVSSNLANFKIHGHELYRVLSNLINNSVESLHGEKEFLRVKIRATCSNEALRVSIEDNGCGIPEEKIPFVLEGKYSSKVNGYGLGLSGARKWVKDNDGSFVLISKVDLGTKIDFMVPVEDHVVGRYANHF